MNDKYQIISDGSCDLPQELTKEKNIVVVPFYVSMDSETYRKEMVEVDVRDFYREMVEKKGVYPKTSMPSTQDYCNAFEPYVKAGVPVICLCITTKFSGSMQSAKSAKDIILEDYPEAIITIVDTEVDTVLQGIYVLEACRLRDMGVGYEEAIERLKAIRSSGRIFFTVGNIEYLKHGGRIGKLAGLAGGMLGIKPLITLKDGEIFPSGIVRSRKKSMDKVIDMLLAYVDEDKAGMSDYSLCIGYGYDHDEALEFRKLALERLAHLGVKEIPIYQIGATIGVHTGPYPIGFGIVKRADKIEI